MSTRSVVVGSQWVMLGPTPLEVSHHNTFGVQITCAEDMPSETDTPAMLMKASDRTFDCPACDVYARAVDGEVTLVVTPRAPYGSVTMPANLLTLDPQTGDVLQEK